MRKTNKLEISTYTIKMRLYPSVAQKEAMDRVLRALHLAFNITFHQVFLKNPAVCSEPNQDGVMWPNYKKMAKKEWRAFLIKENPAIQNAPSTSLMNQNGLFLLDGKRAWETGMHNLPIDPDRRKHFKFYNADKPRRSFIVQVESKNLLPASDNNTVAWIKLPNIGKVKARGFNRKLWFGNEGQYTYSEALQHQELPKVLSVKVSKDTCGDYFASVVFSKGKNQNRSLFLEVPVVEHKEPVGIDVGIKDIAALSTGQKIENKHFKKKHQKTIDWQNRNLSRRWGPANEIFRDYNRNIRLNNRAISFEQQTPLARPSNRFLKLQQRKAVLERKIARQRDSYYHQQTASIVQCSTFIAIETLYVSNMLRNHKLAYALSDVAMSDFLAKLKYKTDRYHIPICSIGAFEPTSQLCSCCGAQNPRLKNLGIRTWSCPQCSARHDRDINAARNILQIAMQRGGTSEEDRKITDTSKNRKTRTPREVFDFPEHPNIAVVFSKELTRFNDPRYVIKDKKTGKVLDDAQGFGFSSITRAKNCYKARLRWAKKSAVL